jgi:hypothetical protein
MQASRHFQIFSVTARRTPPRLQTKLLPNARVISHKPAAQLSANLFSRPLATRVVKPTNFEMPEAAISPEHKAKILVFGAGNFGSCLADHLGDSAHDVFMWARSARLVKHFNTHHRNPDFLKDHVFPDSVTAIGPEFPSADVVRSMDVLLFAIPTQGVR